MSELPSDTQTLKAGFMVGLGVTLAITLVGTVIRCSEDFFEARSRRKEEKAEQEAAAEDGESPDVTEEQADDQVVAVDKVGLNGQVAEEDLVTA